MSMMFSLRSISKAALAELRDDEDLAEAFITFAAGEPASAGFKPSKQVMEIMAMLPPEKQAEYKAQMETVTRQHGLTLNVTAGQASGFKSGAADFGEEVRIDKAWHGIHFILTGQVGEAPGPLGEVVFGGVEIGEDLGYGPMRVMEPGRVVAVAEALRGLSLEKLKEGFRPADMGDVYPGGWDQPDSLEWILDAFEELKAAYAEAASQDRAMMLYLT